MMTPEAFCLLYAFAKAHMEWEAKLLNGDQYWIADDGFPQMTQELWDDLLKLQSLRREAMDAATSDQRKLF